MHMLSDRYRSEFLAVPQLVRFTMASGEHGPEPTLLIKTTTLELKYLLRQKRFGLLLLRVGDSVAYGVIIEDDPVHPAFVWSFFESEDEINALKALEANSSCAVFLFNELAVNVAERDILLPLPAATRSFLDNILLHPPQDTAAAELLGSTVDAFYEGTLQPGQAVRIGPFEVPSWHPITSHYITNRAMASPIHLFETDEGDQQEHIALWLIDNLHPKGAVKNPQIEEPKRARELCDVLMSYEKGMFLIESKTLNVMSRPTLPDRVKLEGDVIKHIDKAVGQLVGAVRNAKNGYRVSDEKNNAIELELTQPPHLIVLVPDLSLLHAATSFGGQFFRETSTKVAGFFHILDPVELLRTVQAAQMIAERSKTITPIMAWDWYLIERSKIALSQPTPNFHVLFRQDRDPMTTKR